MQELSVLKAFFVKAVEALARGMEGGRCFILNLTEIVAIYIERTKIGKFGFSWARRVRQWVLTVS